MLLLILLGFLLLVPVMLAGTIILGARMLVRRPVRAAVLGAGAGALLAVASGADPGGYAIAGGAVVIALSVTLRGRGRRPARVIIAPRVGGPARAPVLPLSSPLDRAWDGAARLTAGDPRVVRARARCDDLLGEANMVSADAALAEWADVVRERVPELIDAAGAAVRADPAARATLMGELAEALDEIGGEAAARLDTRRRLARDRFSTLRTYVRSRTAPNREWL